MPSNFGRLSWATQLFQAVTECAFSAGNDGEDKDYFLPMGDRVVGEQSMS